MKIFFLLIFIIMSTKANTLTIASIEEKYKAFGPFEAGEMLVALDYGVNSLKRAKESKELIIAIHGSDSRGYEWVYPLLQLGSQEKSIAFYRWDTSGCPNQAIKELTTFIKDNPQYKKIELYGHSYGGIVVGKLLEKNFSTFLEGHMIAAPLRGMFLVNLVCRYRPPVKMGNNSTGFQWRTQKDLDMQFKNFRYDPQLQKIDGVSVNVLPETYNGNRLGHNWSLSWVADELTK